VKVKSIPKPMNIPARIDDKKKPKGFFLRN
jgi:hypothetical protein